MPEGHKTHAIARQHNECFAGKRVSVTSPQGRFSDGASRIDGKRLQKVEAIGKQLFYRFGKDLVLQIHLGRYGKFKEHSLPVPDPVGSVRLRMISKERVIDLSGPTTCRIIDDKTQASIVGKLGPDPLAGGKPQEVFAAFQSSNKPVGALLLDQSVIAGVGNIFRAELLFELEIAPTVPAKELSRAQFNQLWKSLCKMMNVGLKYGKIITVTATEAGKPLNQLENKERFRVYGKSQCPKCNTAIEKPKIAGRPLYMCPSCQS